MPTYSFVLNGEQVSVDVPGDVGLLYVIRDLLGVTGPKYGCGVGVCRACTCHRATPGGVEEFQPCVTRMSEAEGWDVTTIEGLADGETLHPVQEAWIDLDVAQCGYCQPGQIMTAAALLEQPHAAPSDADIDEIENICRCGTYFRIRAAIKQAAENMGPGRGRGSGRGRRPADEAAAASGAAATDGTEDGGGLLGAAAGPGSTTQALPATGSGLGAAGLVAAAAAAVRRGGNRDADAGPEHQAE